MENRVGLLGREKEIAYLEQFYQKPENGLVVLYGGRKVGKSSLLKEFCKDKDSAYFRARPCCDREQVYLWSAELAQEGLQAGEYPTYSELLRLLIAKRSAKKVIVIDEFQHLLKSGAQFMESAIQLIHDRWNTRPLMFILCSSSIGWVENSMVPKLGGAAFEISGFLKIRELNFEELFSCFPTYTVRECMEAYAVLGGVPGYWELFEKGLSLKENLCRLFMQKGAVLRQEAERCLNEELREQSVYQTLLAALASGMHKLNELHLHTGFSRAKISVYLKNLMELELVEKVFSFDTAGRENTQKGIYRISSRLVSFYFRFLYPNLSMLELLEPEQFYARYVEPGLESYVGESFYRVCGQYLDKQNREGRLELSYVRSGEWVGKIGTIDVVAQDGRGKTLIAGCSYGRSGMLLADYEWLMFCAKKACLKADAVYLFAMEGFSEELQEAVAKEEKVHLIEWRNLYI